MNIEYRASSDKWFPSCPMQASMVSLYCNLCLGYDFWGDPMLAWEIQVITYGIIMTVIDLLGGRRV